MYPPHLLIHQECSLLTMMVSYTKLYIYIFSSIHCCVFAVIRVSFTTTAVRVNEDVPSGFTQVCLVADSASTRQYTIEVGRRPSGNNPATRKM